MRALGRALVGVVAGAGVAVLELAVRPYSCRRRFAAYVPIADVRRCVTALEGAGTFRDEAWGRGIAEDERVASSGRPAIQRASLVLYARVGHWTVTSLLAGVVLVLARWRTARA